MTGKQVNKDYYSFLKYNDRERWVSYYYQLEEVLTFTPKRVLEVGVGSNVLGCILKNQGVQYQSLDIADDLHPDIVASVYDIPLDSDSVDVVCAFEVLEHIPYDKFEKSVQELVRVAKNGVIISLPHFGPPIKFSLKFPFIKEKRLAYKIPAPKKHVFNGQHYWEIGKRGYPLKKIQNVLKKHGTLIREYVPFDNQYHHFFVLKKYE